MNGLKNLKFKEKDELITYCSMLNCKEPKVHSATLKELEPNKIRYLCDAHYKEICKIRSCKSPGCLATGIGGDNHCNECRSEVEKLHTQIRSEVKRVDESKNNICNIEKILKDKFKVDYTYYWD